ncbi:MAG: glycosyltransferase family 39 protein [Myxococcales bacterium]|nr:glycosyltransferase family 39 protein [Myxococcales bacterium]
MRSRRLVARDVVASCAGCAVLLALFAQRGADTLSWSFYLGALALVVAVVGLLGLLGDSPLDVRGDEAPLEPARSSRPMLVGAVALVLLNVCTAGRFGLFDPWETHYAEVARELIARDDWITLWWGPEGWFLSKPVLLPALVALGFRATAPFVGAGDPTTNLRSIEWAVRLPIVLLAIVTTLVVARLVARIAGTRAGWITALLLSAAPFWTLVSHQAMTDLPFVATMTLAMASLVRALTSDPTDTIEARLVTVGSLKLRVSRWHATVALITAIALPQALYLVTRPVVSSCESSDETCVAAARRSTALGVRWPIERFVSGSANNSAPVGEAPRVPGSQPAVERYSSAPVPSFAQGIAWLALLAIVLRSLRDERSRHAIELVTMYVFAGLSFLAKGPAGLGVPEVVLALFVVCERRWSLLRQLQLRRGLGVFALCALPWYTAISCRLGREYFDRFVVHDLFARSFSGVHGEQGGLGYYVHQLEAGLFPWGAIALVALFSRPSVDNDPRRAVLWSLARAWLAVTFTLFSVMATRFHHYIFPAVVPAAILSGLWLDEHGPQRPRRLATIVPLALSLVTAAGAVGFYREPARILHLFTYNYARAVPDFVRGHGLVLATAGLVASVALALFAVARLRRVSIALLLGASVALSAWLLVAWFPALAQHRSQRVLFEQYVRERPTPDAPLAAYALNWKGESFYSNGSVALFDCGFPSCAPNALAPWLASHRGRAVFVLTERARIESLRAIAARQSRALRVVTQPSQHLDFALVEVQP